MSNPLGQVKMWGRTGLRGGSRIQGKCGADPLDWSVWIGVYIIWTYRSMDLHKDIYPTDFTDLWGYQSIDRSIITYTEPQRTCGSVYGCAGLYIQTFGAVYGSIIQINPTDFAETCTVCLYVWTVGAEDQERRQHTWSENVVNLEWNMHP